MLHIKPVITEVTALGDQAGPRAAPQPLVAPWVRGLCSSLIRQAPITLMIAASLNNVEVVRILLETGVDINYTTLFGLNALQSSDGNAVTQLLLRYDVDLNGVYDIYPTWTPEQLYAAPEYDRRGIYTTILCFQRLEHITGPVDMRSLIHPCSRALRMTPRGWFRWDGDTDAGRYRRRLAALKRTINN